MQRWIPRIIAILVGLSGAISLISALLPGAYDRIVIIREFIPLSVRFGSRILTLLSGFCLIILAQNILGRKRRAWFLSVCLLVLSFLTHLTRGLDIEEALVTVIPLVLLTKYRFLFSVESSRLRPKQILKNSVIILTTLTLYVLFGYSILQTQFSDAVHPRLIELDYIYSATGLGSDRLQAQTRWARWFEDSLSIITTTAGILIVGSFFSPLLESNVPTDTERRKVRDLARYSHNSVAYFATMSDKEYYWNETQTQAICYRLAGSSAVALGDPLGIGSGEEILASFGSDIKRRGLDLILYNVSKSFALRAQSHEYHLVKIGEEAVIPIEAYSLTGAVMADVRHAVSRLEREKGRYMWYRAGELPWSILQEIDQLHTTWLKEKNLPHLGFSMEYYPFPTTDDVSVLTIQSPAGRIWGVLSFLPYGEGKGVVLDMMLRAEGAPSGTIEAGVNAAVEHFRDQGIDEINLGLAPLANTGGRLTSVLGKLQHFYQFKSLTKFKAKFAPRWEPKYVVITKKQITPKIALAVTAVHVKTKLWGILTK